MIKLQTDIVGKRGYFGALQKKLKKYGFFLCGVWEYDRGKFDAKLWKENGETIYLRIPFNVLEGELDRYDAFIEFKTPYIIKHIVHLGLDWDQGAILSVVGLSQFQKPLEKDAEINYNDRWKAYGESLIKDVVSKIDLFH